MVVKANNEWETVTKDTDAVIGGELAFHTTALDMVG